MSDENTSTIKFSKDFDAPWVVAKGDIAEQFEHLEKVFDIETTPETTLAELIVAASVKAQAMYAAARGLNATPTSIPQQGGQAAAPQAMPGNNCDQCGSPAEFKTGTSKSSGKAWKGYFCTANKEHVKWMR